MTTETAKKAFINTSIQIVNLLARYDVDVNDPEIQQDIINVQVSIDNAYHGFDSNGIKEEL